MSQHEETAEPPRPQRRGLRKGVYIIPSLFTTGNIFCGFYAVIESFRAAILVSQGDVESAARHFDMGAIAIGWAVLFDFLDGRIARLTNSTTQFGVEFDSIADVLTFGIAPAVMAYAWGYGMVPELAEVAWAVSFLYLICGALRLARFNVQASKPALQKPNVSGKLDKKAFVGMPIPAGASLLAALVHFWPRPLSQTSVDMQAQGFVFGPKEWGVALLVLMACLGLLMVSTIRHTSFKNVGPRSRNPRMVILLIAILVMAVWLSSRWTLLAIAVLYASHGVIGKLFGMFRHSHLQPHAEPGLDESLSPRR